MARFGFCEGCKTWKHIYVSVVALLSSLGSRSERRQKSTKSIKVCRTCFNSPVLARRLMAEVRETGKQVARGPSEGSLV